MQSATGTRLGWLAAGCFLWLAAAGKGQEAQWLGEGLRPAARWVAIEQPAADAAPLGTGGMAWVGTAGERTVIEVELLEQGHRPLRTAVEVRVRPSRDATAWWWLLVVPILVVIGGSRQRRSLRPARGLV